MESKVSRRRDKSFTSLKSHRVKIVHDTLITFTGKCTKGGHVNKDFRGFDTFFL